MGGQAFGALDAQQGHQAEAQEHRGQAVVAVLQTAVERLPHLNEALLEQSGQRHQHARLGHRLRPLELRRRFHQQPGRREGALRLPRRRHAARTRGVLVASRARRARGRCRGAHRPRTCPPGALRAHHAAVLEALADRLLGYPHLRGDLVVGQPLGEPLLGARQDLAFELARAAGAPPLHLQRGRAALPIARAILMHPAAMPPHGPSDLARARQPQPRLGEHRRREPERPIIPLSAGEDRSRRIKEGEPPVVARRGEVRADHLGVRRQA